MPAKAIVSLVLLAIVAGGLTVAVAQSFGLPLAPLGLVAVVAAGALRLWIDRK
ncbi:MAG: hypothetical protein U1D35_06800 [Paracoccaceae bacterium]|nr:hypothetical protein [Paracoccaceae bacterium]